MKEFWTPRKKSPMKQQFDRGLTGLRGNDMWAVFLQLILKGLSAIITVIALCNSWFGMDEFEIGQIRLILEYKF